jgi:hypothetical protein
MAPSKKNSAINVNPVAIGIPSSICRKNNVSASEALSSLFESKPPEFIL